MDKWLKNFLRPPGDTGWGIHGPTIPHPHLVMLQDWGFWAQELTEMHLSWFKMLDPGDGSAISLAERLINIGIMPVVRFYREEPNPGHINPGREGEAAKRYIDIGAVYFETNNEPDLPLEWRGGKRPDDWLDIVVDNFIVEADIIRNLGGYLLFPAFGPGGRGNPFQMIVDRGRRDLLDANMCLAIHNYCLARPLDYPNDPVTMTGQPITKEEWAATASDKRSGGPMWAWEMGYERVNEWREKLQQPNVTIMEDSTCFRAFEYFDALVNKACGHSIPIFTTEGGYNVGQRAGTTEGDDPRWSKPSPATVAQMTRDMFDAVSAAPDYYFACMPWALGSHRFGEGKPQFYYQGLWYDAPIFRYDWTGCDDPQGRMPVVFALKKAAPPPARADGPLPAGWQSGGGSNNGGIKMAIWDELTEDFFINPANDEEQNGVVVVDPDAQAGQYYWRAIGVCRVDDEGTQKLFVNAIDETGKQRKGTKIGWGWSGMRADERPRPVIIGDKPYPAECDRIDINPDYRELNVNVSEEMSDAVIGLSAKHSHFVLFRYERYGGTDEPEPDTEQPSDNDIEKELSQVATLLNIAMEKVTDAALAVANAKEEIAQLSSKL